MLVKKPRRDGRPRQVQAAHCIAVDECAATMNKKKKIYRSIEANRRANKPQHFTLIVLVLASKIAVVARRRTNIKKVYDFHYPPYVIIKAENVFSLCSNSEINKR